MATEIQTTYGGQPGRRKRGQLTRFVQSENIKSVKAVENLEPDAALVYSGYPADKTLVRKPMQTKFVVQASRDLEASNSTVGNILITPLGGNTDTTPLTATVYGTSHAATMEAIAVKIRAVTGVRSCTVDATARTWTIIASGDRAVSASGFTTTLGSNQATYTYTAGSADQIAGWTVNRDTEPNDNGYCYEAGDTVKMLTDGGVAVVAEEEVTTASTPHIRFVDDDGTNEHRGSLRASAGSSPVVAMPVSVNGNVGIQTGATAGSIADIEIKVAAA